MVQEEGFQALDLFGEVPVTRREVMLWMWKVPAWMDRHASAGRIAAYVRNYNVVEKIRREKLRNGLEAIFGDESCPHCGAALESDLAARIEALEAEPATLRAAAPPAPSFPPLRLVWSAPRDAHILPAVAIPRGNDEDIDDSRRRADPRELRCNHIS